MTASRSRVRPFQTLLQQCAQEVVDNIILNENSTLWDVQKTALLKIEKWFHEEETKNLTSVVVMPNGTGKTGVICCLPYVLAWAALKGRISHQWSKPILVIAPDLTILTQLEKNLCYEPFLHDKNVFTDDEMDCYYKTHVVKTTAEISRLGKLVRGYEVVLCNAQKWRNNDEDIPNYENLEASLFSAVVVDEAHHLPAEQWKNIIDKFSSAKVLFFTATPKRHDGKEITSDQKLSLTQRYTYVLERDEAIRLRLIRNVTFFTQKMDRLGVLSAVKRRLLEKNEQFPLPGENRHRAIVITKNLIEAKEVADTCENTLHWKRIKVVSSKKNKDMQTREKVIKDIQEGNYELIITTKMFLEGFDHPPLSVAGIVTNIVSRVKFAHFVGRIQRIVREPEVESEEITGDIITANDYKQHDLFDQYLERIITDDPTLLKTDD